MRRQKVPLSIHIGSSQGGLVAMDAIDYAESGLDIQYAMLDRHKRFPDSARRPDYILWAGLHIKTYDWWNVPERGRIRIEMIEQKGEIEQGVDIGIEDGHLILVDGTEVALLRTWADPRYDNVAEYPYLARTGRLSVHNVFKREWPDGRATEEKWTGNAGFWVEEIAPHDRIYHCSHGAAPTPDFSLFTFRVTVAASPETAAQSE